MTGSLSRTLGAALLKMLLGMFWGALAFAAATAQAQENFQQGYLVEGKAGADARYEVQLLDQEKNPLDSIPVYAEQGRIVAGDTLDTSNAAYWQTGVRYKDELRWSEPQPFQRGESVELPLPEGDGYLMLQPVAVSLTMEKVDTKTLRYDFSLTDLKGESLALEPDAVHWQLPFGPEGVTPIIDPPFKCLNSPSCIFLPLKPQAIVNACFRQLCAGTPGTPPSTPAGFKTISAGLHHTCGLTHAGQVLCWGDDRWEQQGSQAVHQCAPGEPCNKVPVEIDCIAGSSCRYLSLDAGDYHTCAVDTNGRVWCWGASDLDQAGVCVDHQCAQPTALDPVNPEDPLTPATFASVSAGSAHTCALTRRGSVVCWGDSRLGQAGNQNGLTGFKAVAVGPAEQYASVSAGYDHSCAVTRSGGLECWGNTFLQRQLPGAFNPFFGVPVDVLGLYPSVQAAVDRVSAGLARTCAHAADGTLACLDEAFNVQDVLPAAAALTDLEISATRFGAHRDVCVADGGKLLCHLGTGSTRSPSAGKNFTDVAVGGFHFCGIAGDGSAWCWGDNDQGQLGDGTTVQAADFAPVRARF